MGDNKKDILMKKLSRFLIWCHESVTEIKKLKSQKKCWDLAIIYIIL